MSKIQVFSVWRAANAARPRYTQRVSRHVHTRAIAERLLVAYEGWHEAMHRGKNYPASTDTNLIRAQWMTIGRFEQLDKEDLRPTVREVEGYAQREQDKHAYLDDPASEGAKRHSAALDRLVDESNARQRERAKFRRTY